MSFATLQFAKERLCIDFTSIQKRFSNYLQNINLLTNPATR